MGQPRTHPAWLVRIVSMIAVAAAMASAWQMRAGPRPDRPGAEAVRVRLSLPWAQWRRSMEVREERVARALAAALAERAAPGRLAERRQAALPDDGVRPVWVVTAEFGRRPPRQLWVLPYGELWDPSSRRAISNPALSESLKGPLAGFAGQLFGEPVPWREVDPLFPRDTGAVLEDVRTGVRLHVLRYGGYLHADVEPASPRDTALLKAIYGGEWSWRRRPVVAIIGGRRIAASINGMPHGYGVVRGNDFPGHFCLHFRESRLHRSGRVDWSHQLMVWQAAGRMAQVLEEAAPEQLARWVLAALNEDDEAALKHATTGWDPQLAARLMDQIRHVTVAGTILGPPGSAGEPPAVEVQLVVYYERPDPDTGYGHTLRLNLRERAASAPSGTRGWAIPLADLAKLLKIPAGTVPPPQADQDEGC
ncbi:MAG: hypothetical protein AB1609_07905 [Bacillota bacterium]